MMFSTPLLLVLLFLLIPIAWIGWPRTRFRQARDTISLILRAIMMLLIVLALAGVSIAGDADRLAVAFLLDRSDSVGAAARATQIEYVRTALDAMPPDDQAGVIVFGADPLIERPMSGADTLDTLRSTPRASASDLESAINLAMAMFPPDAARRIVILSDGAQTEGDAEAAARRAAASGVEISTVEGQSPAAPEIQISEVRAPEIVGADQTFDLAITIESETATAASLSVFAAGAPIYTEAVDLRVGTNRYTLTLRAGAGGFRDFRVRVDPVDAAGVDSFAQNNQLSAFSRVIGEPRALLVAQNDADAIRLESALAAQGVAVDRITPSALPIGVAALEAYETVILANVPATALTPRRMRALQTYVRDLGGGLVVVGGETSYAPGGYFQTPLEETLPLEMQIRDQQRLPQLTIAYVIDTSGSMSMVGPSGVENIELAKEAIIRSIDFLQPTDRAGVASFDSGGRWLAEVQPVADRRALQSLVGGLRASGGTDILAGMQIAAGSLAVDPSARKHIILLTDGGASPTGLVELTTRLYAENDVTTSVIAIGGNADFLDDMAIAGGGNYHFVEIVETIPTIFTTETVLATRAYFVEGAFTPSLSAVHPIMNGINELPPLGGYVAATPKTTAQVILQAPEPFRDPILASWQYGLGRAVAFTSDASARWSADWAAWEGFARFWAQAVRWTITEGAGDNLEARVVAEGDRARIVVDARADDGAFLNGLALSASVVAPDLTAEAIVLEQVAPGRYEAVFTPADEGAYFVRVDGAPAQGEDTLNLSETIGYVRGYSPEYSIRAGEARANVLPALAAITGGRAIGGDPAAAFDHTLRTDAASIPLAPWLLLIALLLLPIDIAVRRLLITRGDLERVRAALFPQREVVEAEARFENLRGAKARALGQIGGTPTSEAPTPSPSPEGEGSKNVSATTMTTAAATPAITAAALRQRRAQAAAARGTPEAPTPDPAPSGKGETSAPRTLPTPTDPPPRRETPDPSPSGRGETSAPPGEAGAGDSSLAGRLMQKRKARGG